MPAIICVEILSVNLIIVLLLRTSYLNAILLLEGHCVHVLLVQIPLVQGRRRHLDKVGNFPFHSFST